MVKKLGIILSGLIFILILLEILLRIIGYYHLSNKSVNKNENREIKILCIGDSFTAGEGAKKGEDYPTQLQKILDKINLNKYKVINEGIAAQNSTQSLSKLKDQINEYKPDIIILLTGGANQWNHWGLENTNVIGDYFNDLLYNLKIYKLSVLLYENLKIKKKINQHNIIDNERYNKLMSDFNTKKRANKNDPMAYYNVGQFFMYESNCIKAKEWFIKGIDADKNDFHNYLGLGAAYYELNKFNESVSILKKGIEIKSDEVSLYNMLQQVYIKSGNLDSAIYWTEEGIIKNPDCKDLYIYLSKFETISSEKKQLIDNFFNKYPPKDNIKSCYFEIPIVGAYQNTKWKFKEHPEEETILEWVKSDLGKFITITKQNEIPLIIMNYPYDRNESPFKDTYLPINNVIENIVKKNNLLFVDNNLIFNSMGPKIKDLMEPYEIGMHPTKYGYEQIAQNIYQKLFEMKFIK